MKHGTANLGQSACMLAVVAITAVAAGCSREEHATRMVTVPLVTQTNVVRAYDLLRAAGLRVAIRNAFSAASLCVPIAQKQSPRRGTRAGGR